MNNLNKDLTCTDLALALGESHQDSLINIRVHNRTLVDMPTDSWPAKGAKSVLATFATNQQAYSAFLGMVGSGCRLTTAATSLGFLPKTVTQWLQTAVKHIQAGKDSVYVWFYYDCLRARGSSKVKAEIAAYQNNPEGFIRRVDRGGQYNEEEQIGNEALLRAHEEVIDDAVTDDDDITSAQMTEAFVALAEKVPIDLNNLIEESNKQIPDRKDSQDGKKDNLPDM